MTEAKTTIPWLAVIILAGGKSSRMGKDKALLEIAGQSFLHQTCTLALDSSDRVYVITPWIERYRFILPRGCQLIQEITLPGESHFQGPLVAFAQALTQVEQKWVLLLACDLPQLNSFIIKQWCDALPEIPPSVMAWLPKNSKGWEPLCGFYRRSCLTSLNACIERGDRSFQQWLTQLPVQQLPVSEPQLLFNCNTPEDFKVLKNLEATRKRQTLNDN